MERVEKVREEKNEEKREQKKQRRKKKKKKTFEQQRLLRRCCVGDVRLEPPFYEGEVGSLPVVGPHCFFCFLREERGRKNVRRRRGRSGSSSGSSGGKRLCLSLSLSPSSFFLTMDRQEIHRSVVPQERLPLAPRPRPLPSGVGRGPLRVERV